MKALSNLISVVFHPVFVPIYGLLLFVMIKSNGTLNLRLLDTEDFMKLAVSPILLFSVIFPVFSLSVMYRSNLLTSFNLNTQKERIPVLFLLTIYYGITYYFIRSLDLAYNHAFFGLFLSFLTGGIILSLLSLIMTLKWKISLHGIGIGALAGSMLAFTQELHPVLNLLEVTSINMLLILLIGVVSTARLYLKAHTINQILGGVFLGLFVQFFVIMKHYWV